MYLVGLANTRISTDYAQKIPRSLFTPRGRANSLNNHNPMDLVR